MEKGIINVFPRQSSSGLWLDDGKFTEISLQDLGIHSSGANEVLNAVYCTFELWNSGILSTSLLNELNKQAAEYLNNMYSAMFTFVAWEFKP